MVKLKFISRLLLVLSLFLPTLAPAYAAALDGAPPAFGASAADIRADDALEKAELYKRANIRSVTITNPVSVNAIVATSVNVPVTTLVDGLESAFVAGATNTGAVTYALDSTAATALTSNTGAVLAAGDITSGTQYKVRYIAASTQWRLLQPPAGGSVSSVTCGAGLSGGTFTTSGTCALIGGTLTATTSMSGKAFNEAKGAAVASAATMDIWTPGDGNHLDGTGTATVTSFGTAPQAGAYRWVKVTGAFTVTNNANIVVKGGTRTLTVGDLLFVEADTTTVALVTIFKGDGTAVVGGSAPKAHITVLTSGTSWTSNAAHKWAEVTVIGGGGGSNNSVGIGSGAGTAKKIYTLAASTAYTYAVGAAGSGVGGTSTAGNGGNSTFTDGTTLITGGGGVGGVQGTVSAGGTATNGDLNLPGGPSGITASTGGASGGGYGQGGSYNGGGPSNSPPTGYGGGGGGASQAGSTGAVIITEYY